MSELEIILTGLREIRSELWVADIQRVPSDDAIIMDHVRTALVQTETLIKSLSAKESR